MAIRQWESGVRNIKGSFLVRAFSIKIDYVKLTVLYNSTMEKAVLKEGEQWISSFSTDVEEIIKNRGLQPLQWYSVLLSRFQNYPEWARLQTTLLPAMVLSACCQCPLQARLQIWDPGTAGRCMAQRSGLQLSRLWPANASPRWFKICLTIFPCSKVLWLYFRRLEATFQSQWRNIFCSTCEVSKLILKKS